MTTKEQVLRKVLEIGEAQAKQVATELGLDYDNAKGRMITLANEGKLKRVARGIYAVSEKWEAILTK